jgi:hypothetical protein
LGYGYQLANIANDHAGLNRWLIWIWLGHHKHPSFVLFL